ARTPVSKDNKCPPAPFRWFEPTSHRLCSDPRQALVEEAFHVHSRPPCRGPTRSRVAGNGGNRDRQLAQLPGERFPPREILIRQRGDPPTAEAAFPYLRLRAAERGRREREWGAVAAGQYRHGRERAASGPRR